MASIFPVRPSTRRQGASVSYKEDSADETGSEDLVEVNWENNEGATAAEPDNAETIERIIDTRFGRKGGILCPNTILEQVMNDYSNPLATGPTTTIYAVEENGDPNGKFDPAKEPNSSEQQFLIKWLGWSHIHNTWESEQTLRDQKVKFFYKHICSSLFATSHRVVACTLPIL